MIVLVVCLLYITCVMWTCSSLQSNWEGALSKIKSFQEQHERSDDKVLVIYHIGSLHLEANSLDIASNNVKLFLGAIENHSNGAATKAFYLFNVVDATNPLLKLIPTSKYNVEVVHWANTTSDMDTHLRTLDHLTTSVTDKFTTAIFTNQGVRGPLVHRQNAEWILDFIKPLQRDNIGIVGPTLSCEINPHVQTHTFALRTALIPTIQERIAAQLVVHSNAKHAWLKVIMGMEVGLTGTVRDMGYNVSSFLHQSRGQPYFQHCLPVHYTGASNPSCWCHMLAKDIIFLKYGGEALRNAGYVCHTTVHEMEDMLPVLASEEPHLQLTVPEVLRGGKLYPLFVQYAHEAWLDRHPVLYDPLASNAKHEHQHFATSSVSSPSRPGAIDSHTRANLVRKMSHKAHHVGTVAAPEGASKVCFLVRVIKPMWAPPKYENLYSHIINSELELLVRTLRRQSNPNWVAMFYRIDDSAGDDFSGLISRTIDGFSDPRLEYKAFDEEVAKYSPTEDSGYSATGRVLQVAAQRAECTWLSVTTSDNAYGSEVVQQVLSTSDQTPLALVPMDSRRYLDHTYHPNSTAPTQLPQQMFSEHTNAHAHTKHATTTSGCSFLPNVIQNLSTHLVRMDPAQEKVELAAAFLRRDKFVAERVRFGDFSNRTEFPCSPSSGVTDPVHVSCLNTQGAHLLHHLVHSKRWTYARLPFDGLRSVVFHGNSPTLCIGADNVWLDHNNPLERRCVTHMDAAGMKDRRGGSHNFADFKASIMTSVMRSCVGGR